MIITKKKQKVNPILQKYLDQLKWVFLSTDNQDKLKGSIITFRCFNGHINTIPYNTLSNRAVRRQKSNTDEPAECSICISSKYSPQNMYDKLLKGGFELERLPKSSKDSVPYKCSKCFQFRGKISYSSFLSSSNRNNVCISCTKITQKEDLDIDADIVKIETNSIHQRANITINCRECGQEYTCLLNNLERNDAARCAKCKKKDFCNDITKVRQDIVNYGIKWIGTSDEYINRRSKLTIVCSCSRQNFMAYCDIKRGRKCNLCWSERRVKTYRNRYIDTNQIRAMILEGHEQKRKNLGLERSAYWKHISSKRVETVREKYQTDYAFHTQESRLKYIKCITDKYGVDCIFKIPDIQNNIQKTNKEKYGHTNFITSELGKKMMIDKYGNEYYIQSDDCKTKMTEKYGSEYYIQSDDCKTKMTEKYGSEYYVQSVDCKTKMTEKYGSEYYIQSDDCKTKMTEKYGSEYYVQSDDCKAKMTEKYGNQYYILTEHFKETMVAKYGVENAMQNPDILHKAFTSGCRYKDFELPSGKILRCMGYEPHALKLLLKVVDEKYIENDCRNIPKFVWFENGKKHTYIPDIMVSFEHTRPLIIEVKSLYTWQIGINSKELNYKMDTVYTQDYDIEVWVFDKITSKTIKLMAMQTVDDGELKFITKSLTGIQVPMTVKI